MESAESDDPRSSFNALQNMSPNSYSGSSKSPSPTSKRGRVGEQSFPTMSALDGRTARYGWFIQECNNISVIQRNHPNYPIDDPDDYACFNEKKPWAGSFAMCVGQKNLCKWL